MILIELGLIESDQVRIHHLDSIFTGYVVQEF